MNLRKKIEAIVITAILAILVISVVAQLAVPAQADLAGTYWPMFHHDLQHTGRSDWYLPPGAQTNDVKWSYTTGGAIRSSPTIGADSTIYVGSTDNKLYAIKPDGSLKWSYTTGGEVDSSPAIGSDGTIYVGSDDDKLYAIKPDGSLKWSYTTDGSVASSPAIGDDGTIYVGSWGDWFYAINPDAINDLKWCSGIGSGTPSSPAIGSDGTIYVGSIDGRLLAFSPEDVPLEDWSYTAIGWVHGKSPKWSYTTGSWIESSPAIGSDGTIYVGSGDKKLYAIKPDGTKKWSYTTGSYVRSSPAIGSDGTIYVGSDDNKLYAIKPDGTKKWSYTTGGYVRSSPAIGSDGTIYVGSDDNKLYAINPNGSLKWSYTTIGGVRSSPAIDGDGTIYVGSLDGKLYAFVGTYTVTFKADCGGEILFDVVLYNDGGSVSKPGGTYNIVAYPGANCTFVKWETTGGFSVANASAASTTCTLSGKGTGTLRMVQHIKPGSIGIPIVSKVTPTPTPTPTPTFIPPLIPVCPSGCECLTVNDAELKFGVGSFVACSDNVCGYGWVGDLYLPKYCFREISNQTPVTIEPYDFSITIEPKYVEVKTGDSITYELTISSTADFNAPVELSLTTKAPFYNKTILLPTQYPPYPKKVSYTVTIPENIPPCTAEGIITATGGGKTHTDVATVKIPGFEAIFAIFVILAITYLLRKRKKGKEE